VHSTVQYPLPLAYLLSYLSLYLQIHFKKVLVVIIIIRHSVTGYYSFSAIQYHMANTYPTKKKFQQENKLELNAITNPPHPFHRSPGLRATYRAPFSPGKLILATYRSAPPHYPPPDPHAQTLYISYYTLYRCKDIKPKAYSSRLTIIDTTTKNHII